jgi:hypothetical protein
LTLLTQGVALGWNNGAPLALGVTDAFGKLWHLVEKGPFSEFSTFCRG